MPGDARRFRHQVQQVVGKVHRFDGTEAQPLHIRLREQPAQQIGQPHLAARLPAPPPQIDSAQHDLAISPGEGTHLLDRLLGGRAAAPPAHERYDAEGAAIVAAVLNLQIGARTVAGRVFHRRRQKIALLEDVADVNIAVVGGRRHDLRDLGFVRVAHHPLHPGHGRQFVGGALRIAARDQNPCRRILAVHPPYGLPHVVVRRRSHGAGVEHHQVRAGALAAGCKSFAGQQRLQSGAVGLGGPASEVLNEESLHYHLW
jgi:hypothetical protein